MSSWLVDSVGLSPKSLNSGGNDSVNFADCCNNVYRTPITSTVKEDTEKKRTKRWGEKCSGITMMRTSPLSYESSLWVTQRRDSGHNREKNPGPLREQWTWHMSQRRKKKDRGMRVIMECNHIYMGNWVSFQEAGVRCLRIIQHDFVVKCVVTMRPDERGAGRGEPQQPKWSSWEGRGGEGSGANSVRSYYGQWENSGGRHGESSWLCGWPAKMAGGRATNRIMMID